MPNAAFEQARRELEDANRALRAARTALAAAGARRAGLERDLAAARRAVSRTRIDTLTADLDAATRAEAAADREVARRILVANGRDQTFGELSDPRVAIGALDAHVPVLLLPVRLEARFKHLSDANGDRDELWVRIYPDDCAIDTFEADLTDEEYTSGCQYWIESWAAGGIDGQERAAWRNLAASRGIGRAAWILQTLVPGDLAGRPVKARAEDVVLVIAVAPPATDQQRRDIARYWKAVWLADGDQAAMDRAFEDLGGTTAAAALIERYQPVNLNAAPPASVRRADVTVDVGWLVPPPRPARTRSQSWSAAPVVRVLPDRFVVIGRQSETTVFEALGNPIPVPLVVGPNPSAPPDQQLRPGPDGDLLVPDDIKWMVDFDEAVAHGMGVRIPLDPAKVDLKAPIEQLMAIGVRVGGDAASAQSDLENLLTHHRFGRSGLSVVPQGTPTNNTDAAGSGYDRVEDADTAYDSWRANAGPLTDPDDWLTRCDGRWLADTIGIDSAVLKGVPHATGQDIAEALAMNRALWPATLGYTMATLLAPVFPPEAVRAVRWFYTRLVSGRGFVPAIRIGDQPYGIVPVGAAREPGDGVPEVAGLNPPDGFSGALPALAAVVATLRTTWEEMAAKAPAVGQSGDPHQLLLDVLGLHPASIEFHQRYAEGLEHLYNQARFLGRDAQGDELAERFRDLTGDRVLTLLRELGYQGDEAPDAIRRLFLAHAHRLNGPVVDDRPLSESRPIRAHTGSGKNYITRLVELAMESFESLRRQTGFTNDTPPDALLYLLLRHALMLAYFDAALDVHVSTGLLEPAARMRAQREPAFVHVAGGRAESESRFTYLYRADTTAGGGDRTVADRVTESLTAGGASSDLSDQLAAMALIADRPTARLERCLAEHLDTVSHRLDAWIAGLTFHRLAALRYPAAGTVNRGLHLGAFGWLEQLRRKPEPVAVALAGELAATFQPAGAAPLTRDVAGGGFIAAPSTAHATTAAILRAGYLANASTTTPDALAVNLASRRVRQALEIIDGIRAGQPLGALLGYRLQRGLHERDAALAMDLFVVALRKEFPFVADAIAATVSGADDPIESLEANNVIDGLKLVEHIRKTGNFSYPFGLGLRPANDDQRAAINEEVAGLLDSHDALADLALAEGVHQAVLGNYDRVASTLDAYAKGTFPPEPDVVRTPADGYALTHRVGLHFKAGVNAAVSPVAGIPMTPRAMAQPMVNDWLAGVLPDPATVACLVEWMNPVTTAMEQEIVSQRDLELQPIDLVHIGTLDGEAAMSELDDRIVRRVMAARAPRPDAPLIIRHTAPVAGRVTFFELAPLVRSLRACLLRSRPLAATDLAPPASARADQDLTSGIDRTRVTGVRDLLRTLATDLGQFVPASPIAATIDGMVALFERAARFGIQQVGWGFLYQWRRRTFGELIARTAAMVARWTERLDSFDHDLAAYDALPAAAADRDRFLALGQLDLLVAGRMIAPRPQTPAAYRAALPARRDALAAKRQQLRAIVGTADPDVDVLLAAVATELPIDAFDTAEFTTDDITTSVTTFISEAKTRLAALSAEIATRLRKSADSLTAHDQAGTGADRIAALQQGGKDLVGNDLQLIPEFAVAPAQAGELSSAHADRDNGTLLRYLAEKPVAFPVDEWLHGVARVREKVREWEQTVLLAGVLSGRDLLLQPVQLPYQADDRWLALEIDPAHPATGDRLLYTAHYAAAPNPAAATCGLLLDEWTEVIPADSHTAGVSFRFDRPNAEAPQAWLLAVPASTGKRWQWADLVGALDETRQLLRIRAVEPRHVEATPYAALLPATVSAAMVREVSIAVNYAQVNRIKDAIG